MSKQAVGAKIQADLSAAIASGQLPPKAHEKAEKLLNRLQQPVRLAIMGLSGSGKSALTNLLLGGEVLPAETGLPTVQLIYGDTPKTTCTMPDGTQMVLDHADPHLVASLHPAFVEMAIPLPALKKISVLEVTAPDDPNAQHKAMQWAVKRCDVALWCTKSFTDVEQQLWAQIPDIIKDHAFLMLTHADALAAAGSLDNVRAHVDEVAKPEFAHVMSIATLNAISARAADGHVDKDKMRSSGGSALITSVLRHVQQGQQSFIDLADILLRQNKDVLPTADISVKDVEPAKQPEEPKASPKPTLVPAPELTVAAKPKSPEKPDAPAKDGLQIATRTAYTHAVERMNEQGKSLITLADSLGDAAPSQIMAKTVEYIQWLSDYLIENGDDADPALQRSRDSAMDAADLVQLMQMEKRDSATVEAVSLMIQLKREIQAEIAA